MTLTVAPLHTFSITDGRSIDMFPAASECTVAQAARFLEGTEGLVNELLDAELIAFRLENGERLIERNDLQRFVQDRERRHVALDEMVRLNQEMGLYDD